MTDSDGDSGFDEVIIDVVTPTATAATGDPLIGAGPLVDGTGSDITMRNHHLAMSIPKVTVDPQLEPYPFGHVLAAAPTGGTDGLDWILVGYVEPTHTEGPNSWDVQTVNYTAVDVTDPGTSHDMSEVPDLRATADCSPIVNDGSLVGIVVRAVRVIVILSHCG